GYAVGDAAAFLSYANGVWQRDESASRQSEGLSLVALSLGDTGTNGWAVAQGGESMRLASGVWVRSPASDPESLPGVLRQGSALRAFSLDRTGTGGWAVGDGGLVLRCTPRCARDDDAARLAAGANLTALAGDDQSTLWIVGRHGVVLSRARSEPRWIR